MLKETYFKNVEAQINQFESTVSFSGII